MKPKLKAILFDMGGTLIEFENSTWDVLNQLCAKEGYAFLKKQNLIAIGYENFLDFLSKEFEKRWIASERTLQEINFERVISSLFKELGLNLTNGNMREFVINYYQPVTDQITLIQGAVETLRFFKQRNLKVGLISNTIFPKILHLKELKRFDLDQYLDIALFSSEVGFKKPHPQIFHTALEKLDAVPDFAVFVGDRLEEDIEGAQKVGMRTILIRKDGRDYSTPIPPDARINSLIELPEVVLKLFDI